MLHLENFQLIFINIAKGKICLENFCTKYSHCDLGKPPDYNNESVHTKEHMFLGPYSFLKDCNLYSRKKIKLLSVGIKSEQK